jgi:hypothetical protein
VVKHAACKKTCGRKHGTCNHDCNRQCHDGTDCGLCQEPCEVSDTSLPSKYVLIPSRYVASTQSVHKSAMSLALRALSYVYGHVNIKATARCLVRPHAAAYLATSAAPSSSYAATSVQAFAVKYAPSVIVRNVA